MSRWTVAGGSGLDTSLRDVVGIVVDVVADDDSAPVRAANSTALNDACTQAIDDKVSRILLPPGTIHYGTTGEDSGITIPHGINAVEIVGGMLGPHNDGHVGTTLSYWGTGAAIELDEDDGNPWNSDTYGGVEGFSLTNLALIYGGTATTALANGKGNYGTGTYGLRDWRGGRVNLFRCYIAGFEYGFWGVQSDENSVYEGKVKRCKVGYFLGPRSDQFLMQSLEALYCDTVIELDGVHQARFYACQWVNCGSASTPTVRILNSSTRPTVGATFDSCWFENLHGADSPSFIDVGVGDDLATVDTLVVNPYMNTHLSGGGVRTATFMRIGNAQRTTIINPSMQYNTMFDELVAFQGATPASPDLTIQAHEWHQTNTTIDGTQNPVVSRVLRTYAGSLGVNGPIALFNSEVERRWQIQLATTETGSSNTGSDFQLTGYNDDGTFLSNFITMTRGGTINLANFVNFAPGTGQGTKIGTGTTQKIGFWGATPIVRPTGTPAAATDLATALTLLNSIRTALINAGLIS